MWKCSMASGHLSATQRYAHASELSRSVSVALVMEAWKRAELTNPSERGDAVDALTCAHHDQEAIARLEHGALAAAARGRPARAGELAAAADPGALAARQVAARELPRRRWRAPQRRLRRGRAASTSCHECAGGFIRAQNAAPRHAAAADAWQAQNYDSCGADDA